MSDLSDGTSLAVLIAAYCPEHLSWSEIASLARTAGAADATIETTMADSLYNIQLVQKFCREALPFNVCHLTIEDMVYLHESIR